MQKLAALTFLGLFPIASMAALDPCMTECLMSGVKYDLCIGQCHSQTSQPPGCQPVLPLVQADLPLGCRPCGKNKACCTQAACEACDNENQM